MPLLPTTVSRSRTVPSILRRPLLCALPWNSAPVHASGKGRRLYHRRPCCPRGGLRAKVFPYCRSCPVHERACRSEVDQGSMGVTAVWKYKRGRLQYGAGFRRSLGFRTHTPCSSYRQSCKAGICSVLSLRVFIPFSLLCLPSFFFLDESCPRACAALEELSLISAPSSPDSVHRIYYNAFLHTTGIRGLCHLCLRCPHHPRSTWLPTPR